MKRILFGVVLSSLLVAFAGCGGCDENAGSANGNGPGTGADGYAGDAPVDGAGTTGDDGGGSSSDDDGGGGGSSKCPGTQTLCGGECVSTRLDPDHCGSCGNTCAEGTVCNGGECVDSQDVGCPQGMAECDGTCVDLGTNDDHCGNCGDTCPDDKACNHGDCTNVVDVGPSPGKCSGGGPSIDIVDGDSETRDTCTGRVAKTTFRWALCSCDDVNLNNELLTDAYDSKKGPYQPGGYGGGVGTNGEFKANNTYEIWGALWTSSPAGISANNTSDVKLQLHSQGGITFQSVGHVRGDAYVGGDIVAQDDVEFHETLHIPSSAKINGSVTTKQTVRQSVDVSEVCGRCKSENAIPVRDIVSDHADANDNDLIDLDEDALVQPGGKNVLRLPCGSYYLSEINVNDETTVVATGNTALFVDGDIDTGNKFILKPKPGATLDVFVSGNVHLNNEVEVGSPAYAANTRFYVGGPGGWNLNNKGVVGANVYAIPGGVHANNEYDHYGALYTQNLDANNKVNLHYDREVLDSDKECSDPDPDPDPGADAGYDTGPGSGGDGGGSGRDGGGTDDGGSTDGGGGGDSTCSQKGESCGSDVQCCSPLVCNDGTCQTTGCNNLYDSCSQDSDCCSGLCGDGQCVGS